MPTAVVVAAFDAATDDAVLAAREVVRTLGIPLRTGPRNGRTSAWRRLG